MKTLCIIITFLCISVFSYGQTCTVSTARVNNLVEDNWRFIQKKAKFTISNKKDFSIRGYNRDGNDLEVSVLSRGYYYDIRFTVSFDDWFDEECYLHGTIIGVYNYKKL